MLFKNRIFTFVSIIICALLISSCETEESLRRIAEVVAYENFEAYEEDFNRIKDLVVRTGGDSYYIYKDPICLRYSKETFGELIEVDLNDEQAQSIYNIISNSIDGRMDRIFVDENRVYFSNGSGSESIVGCGVMYTENVDNVKKKNQNNTQYVHLDGNWYAVIA